MKTIVKFTGSRGTWYAYADDQLLPVLHDTRRIGNDRYFDPMNGVGRATKKYTDFVKLLQDCSTVIVQRDKRDGTLSRAGYIGTFRFSDLKVHDDGSISLTIGEQVGTLGP